MTKLINGDTIINSLNIVGNLAELGGFAGEGGNTFTKCLFTGYLNTNSSNNVAYIGGFMGYTTGAVSINESSWENQAENKALYGTHIGGFIGYKNQSVTISKSFTKVTISSVTAQHLGGFIGTSWNYWLNISDSYADNNFSSITLKSAKATDTVTFGGFMGYHNASHEITITKSKIWDNTIKFASIGTNSEIGGFIGFVRNTGTRNTVKIENCSFDSRFTKTTTTYMTANTLGGLVGRISTNHNLIVNNCYVRFVDNSVGAMSVGSIIGNFENTYKANNSSPYSTFTGSGNYVDGNIYGRISFTEHNWTENGTSKKQICYNFTYTGLSGVNRDIVLSTTT